MKLSCVLLACNENTKYLSFWPIVKTAWKELVGVSVKMVYIGHEKPWDDDDIILFEPITGWPTATQAQAIRLLYPAVLETDGAVMIGDIDCMPLNGKFFKKEFEKAEDNEFVSLRAPLQGYKEICMMYVGGRPAVWGELFGVNSVEDVRRILQNWSSEFSADGEHGGKGWTTDQEILYEKVMKFPRANLSSWEWEIPRLDRAMPLEWHQMNPWLQGRLSYGYYIDFHMPPLAQFRAQILQVLEFALKCKVN